MITLINTYVHKGLEPADNLLETNTEGCIVVYQPNGHNKVKHLPMTYVVFEYPHRPPKGYRYLSRYTYGLGFSDVAMKCDKVYTSIDLI